MIENPINITFICLGNICRSPTAEAIFKKLLFENDIRHINVDSHATSSWEVGNPRDIRSQDIARQNGVKLVGFSQQIRPSMRDIYDYFFVMDKNNYKDVVKIIGNSYAEKVYLLGQFSNPKLLEISDPYHGTHLDFENTFEEIYRSCEGLLKFFTQT